MNPLQVQEPGRGQRRREPDTCPAASPVTPLPNTGLTGLECLKGKGSRCLRPGAGLGAGHAATAGFVGGRCGGAEHGVRPVIPGDGPGEMDDGPGPVSISFKSVRSPPVAPHCRTAGKASAAALNSRRDGTLSSRGEIVLFPFPGPCRTPAGFPERPRRREGPCSLGRRPGRHRQCRIRLWVNEQ